MEDSKFRKFFIVYVSVLGVLVVLEAFLFILKPGKGKEAPVVVNNTYNNCSFYASIEHTFNRYESIQDYISSVNPSLTNEEIDQIVSSTHKYCQLYEVEEAVAYAMMKQESDFHIRAKSFLGADSGRGLMQVSSVVLEDYNNKHWKNPKTIPDMYSIDSNIKTGLWAYRYNVKYGVPDNVDDLVVAYNCGQSTYKKEKDFLLNGERKSGDPYRHLNKVRAILIVTRNIPF